MITDAELNKLEDNFETADLLRAVDEIDKMRSYLNDRDNFRPPQIRDDLLKLHGLGDRLINARAKGVASEFFDLAEELDGQVFDLLESLEAVRDILAKLTELYPESLVE
ncbi:transposase [Sinorhizobium meliloti]|uniref:Transposase n=1 Tax=Rhizobium meliloti TaxID=382 RepID=A0AAW9TUA2_RHIML|nr:transposase [Sinorhizobium meliloti]MQW35544.1 transposase [Sinorhizobium meliloti]